ncbi:hypothetical protein Hanom_Chr10g00880361 [Helianthus anomalus]
MDQNSPSKASPHLDTSDMIPSHPEPMSSDNPFRSIPPPTKAFSPNKPSTTVTPVDPPPAADSRQTNAPSKALEYPPAHNNILLAGYLAHEFLTKGTLFGEVFDPAQAKAPPSSTNNSREAKD